jgi:cytochrome c
MAIVLITLAGTASRTIAGQGGPTTVLDGVYTEAQAKRGEKLYDNLCSLCHGNPPTGTTGPPLVGDDFLANFGGMTLGDLFSKISKTMPSDDPGTLTPAQTADVLAFVLSQNKWPAGQKELFTDMTALKQIQIVKK